MNGTGFEAALREVTSPQSIPAERRRRDNMVRYLKTYEDS
jgi:hypothetical protein